MALNGTSGLQSNLSFTPQTVEEALVPFTKYQQEFEKQQAINDAVQQGIAKYAPYIDKERDPLSYSLYQHINNQVDQNAGYIGTPGFLLNLDGIRNMKYQYQDASNKFADQLARKQADQEMAKQEMLKHPNLQYQFHDGNGNMYQLDQLSMDHYWNGARPTFYSVDADDVKNEATKNAQALIGQMGGHEEASTWGKVLTGADASGLVEQIHKTGGTSWAFKGIPPEVTPDMLVNPDQHQEEWNKVLSNPHYAKYREHLDSLRNMAQNSSKYFNYILSRTNYDKMSEEGKRKLMESALLGMQQGLNNFSDKHTTQYDETSSLRNPGQGGGAGGGNGSQIYDNLSPLNSQVISTGTMADYKDSWWNRIFDPGDSGLYSYYDAFRHLGLSKEQMENLTQDQIDDEDFDLRDKHGLYGMRADNFDRVDDVNKLLDSNIDGIVDYMTLWDENGNVYNHDDFVKNNKARFDRMYDKDRYANHARLSEFDKIVGNYSPGVQQSAEGLPIRMPTQSSEELMEAAYKDSRSTLRSLGFSDKDIDKGLTKKQIVQKMREVARTHLPRKNGMAMFRFDSTGEEVRNVLGNMFPMTNGGNLPIKKITKAVNDGKDGTKVTFETEGVTKKITDFISEEKSKQKPIRFGLTPKTVGDDAGIVMEYNGDEMYLIPFSSISETVRTPIMNNYALYQTYNSLYDKNSKRIKKASGKDSVTIMQDDGKEYTVSMEQAKKYLESVGIARAQIQQALMQNMRGASDVWDSKKQK